MSPAIARILDANLNRAREALRAMEDYARFVLEDPAGCEVLKRLRHELAAALNALPPDALLAGRDTPGDVGTGITTESERLRSTAHDVFTAAAKRLPEALRTIEEYTKTFNPGLAADIEQLRYRAYDAEQRLALRGRRSARFAATRLYVLITEALCSGRHWLAAAEQAIAGGADCLQLREKELQDGELLARARQMAELCHQRHALLIINDRPDIAVLSGADGVHLGQSDLPIAEARRVVGPDRLIGVSTHTPEQLRAAIGASPDYVAVGPMFETATKLQDHVAGPDLLALALRETQIPIVPIGGIDAARAGILIRTGAQRLCVCSAVIGAGNPSAAARELNELLGADRA